MKDIFVLYFHNTNDAIILWIYVQQINHVDAIYFSDPDQVRSQNLLLFTCGCIDASLQPRNNL